MTGSYALLLLLGLALAATGMAVLWVVQVRTQDASLVDVAWAIGIACLATMYALLADGDAAHRLLARRSPRSDSPIDTSIWAERTQHTRSGVSTLSHFCLSAQLASAARAGDVAQSTSSNLVRGADALAGRIAQGHLFSLCQVSCTISTTVFPRAA